MAQSRTGVRGGGCNPLALFLAWFFGMIPIGIGFDALGLPDWTLWPLAVGWAIFLLWWVLFRSSGGAGGAGTWKHGPDADGF
ncbi:MAG: hypothetical protein OXG64_08100 [Chloroflexi bacterium]|nr:hypothetical protein [Chloroflexota bacterium]